MKAKVGELKAFNKGRLRLQSLLDHDAPKAINEARALPSHTSRERTLFSSLKAGILVDAGSQINDKQAIEDGLAIFRELLSKAPKRADLHYNLGNALIALSDQEPYRGPEWYLLTATNRREAKNHFQQAISLDGNQSVRSLALTNLGNALWKAHRWVEAYDFYRRALEHDSSNAVAATGAAKVILRCVARGIGDTKVLQSVATGHLRAAKLHINKLTDLAGARAQKELSNLFEKPLLPIYEPDLGAATDYEKFVARHRLALSLTIEGLICSLKRWDSATFKSVTEPVGTPYGVPSLFAMLNVMKSDFLAARHLAYRALSETLPESGLYADTLDYAVYGIVPSLLSLAQRACIDVLDKIAVATTEYFRIPGPSRNVYFWNRWFDQTQKGRPLAWHPILRPVVLRGNTATIALAEISLDIGEDGFLHRKKAYRHASTHRFTVLHDVDCSPSRESVHVQHAKMEEFKIHLIESLQLARAAILYFIEMIAISEHVSTKRREKTFMMTVPSHHHIRGDTASR